MNILHLTDYHYQENNPLNERVIESIVKTIVSKEIRLDLVLFTGDLVQSGTHYTDFIKAKKILIDPLINRLNINSENILFCPGNHDIDRGSIHGAIESYINLHITNDWELNNFQVKAKDVYKDSLAPLGNYKKFITEYYSNADETENFFNDLYSIHYRIVNEKKLGIVSLNSAWLSAIDKERKGVKDKGNLLIPNVLLSEIKKELKENRVDKKIVLIHHPLYFLKEFNLYGVESSIHNDFDIMFSGHVHKVSSISRFSGTNGIFEHISKASLSSNENLGCSIIEISEVEENKINVIELTYIEDDDLCHASEPIVYTVPCGSGKLEIIAFRRKLFEKIEIEKENANSLLLLNDKEHENDFLSLYRTPVLKKEPEDSLDSKTAPLVNIDEILNSKKNFIILGKDKCGKSSLLRKIQLECLINYSRNGNIPFLLDCKEQGQLNTIVELERLIRGYFGISNSKTNDILSSDSFIFLLDNYSPHSAISQIINDFLFKYNKIRYIACAEYNLSMKMEIFQFGETRYEKLYNYDLRRQEIIAYTDNRLRSNSKKSEIQDKIIQLCKQLELPLNYWTLSLLLLIYNKSAESYSKNLFSILDVCIDEIFGKKQLSLSNKKIGFEQLKNIGARLSKYLFKNHQNTVYSASYSSILQFIESEISSMIRLTANAKDILDFYIDCGLLKYKNNNSLLVFRLNGFFEYFLALQMTKDNDFKLEIINDEVKYLAFRNQLEVYSGFKRDDADLLKTAYDKTKNKIDRIFFKYGNDKDTVFKSKVEIPQKIEDFSRRVSVKKALSSNEIALIEDNTNELDINSDVHLVKEINPNDINSELIERYLSILSRVFKNLDEVNISDADISEIFNYIIDSYCNLGFFIIDEFASLTKNEIESEIDLDIHNIPEFDLLKFVSGFSPVISQTWLSDNISHSSLEKVIISEIEKYEKQSQKNQFKLFLLYFLLLDIDLKSNREYIKNIMNNIKIPGLKYAVYIKLSYYLVFKSGKDTNLQQELSNHIQKAQLNLDNKKNIESIQKDLQEKKLLAQKKNNPK